MKKPSGRPCKECPFKRTSMPGYLGASTTQEFFDTTMADAAMPCHTTVDYDNPDWREKLSDAKFCSGALIFFRNICKLSRDPKRPRLDVNRELVFGTPLEFLSHHADRNPNDADEDDE